MNWKQLLSEISNDGKLTQTEIATVCGTSQGHISDLLNGNVQQPSYVLGKAIETLHAKYVKRVARAKATT